MGLDRLTRGWAATALFPPIVAGMVSLGFLIGLPVGETAAAAWWMAALGVGGAAWWLGGWRGLAAAALWCVATFFVANTLTLAQLGDYFHYHYPQVFALEAGWNPVFASSMQEACAAVGVDAETLRPVHAFCFPLLLAQFCAVVDGMTRSLCGFVWAPLLIVPATVWLTVRTLRRWLPLRSRAWIGWGGAAVVLIFGYRVPFWWVPMDAALFLLETMLALCVVWLLGTGRRRWPAVWFVACAVTALGIKQSAAVFVLVALAFLAATQVFRRDWQRLWWMVTLGMWTACGVALFAFHPYLTNWADYGGPLFPNHTFWEAWEGWDVIIDLGNAPALLRPNLLRFVATNPLWCLAFALALPVCLRRAPRRWMAPAAILLVAAAVVPARNYGYVRYAPTLPLVFLFAGLALWRCPIWGRRIARWLFLPIGALCLAYMMAFSGKLLLSQARNATDLNDLLNAREAVANDLVIVSTRATATDPDSIYLRAPRVYPLRPHTYFLNTLFGRYGTRLREDTALTAAQADEAYVRLTDIWLFVRQDSPAHRRLTQRPLRLEGVLSLPRRVWRQFETRWVKGDRGAPPFRATKRPQDGADEG